MAQYLPRWISVLEPDEDIRRKFQYDAARLEVRSISRSFGAMPLFACLGWVEAFSVLAAEYRRSWLK